MICPKCGFEQDPGGPECLSCGVIFSKVPSDEWQPGGSPAKPTTPAGMPEPAAEPSKAPRPVWEVLAIGALLTAAAWFFPFARYVFQAFLTLVHELGHAAAGWIFGYPSIPAFDFTYGGGVTIHQDRSQWLLGLAYLLLFGALFRLRQRPRAFWWTAAALVCYALLAHTAAHDLLIVAMGHGFELLFAGIFLYRAISGRGCIYAAERPLYAFVSFFILLSDLYFAHRLHNSPTFRSEYRSAKGGGDWMDFSRLAREYLHTDLPTVATLFLVGCLLVPLASWLVFRYRERLLGAFRD